MQFRKQQPAKQSPKPEKIDELTKRGQISSKGFTCPPPCRQKNPIPFNWEIRHRVTPYKEGEYKGEAVDEHYVVVCLPSQISCLKCRKNYRINLPPPEECVIQRHYIPENGKSASSAPSFGDAKEQTLQIGLVGVINKIRFSPA